jgi:hypothetical protein
VYLPVVRSSLYDVFQAFDFADPSTPNGDRATTTIAPQALFMMNSQIVSRQSGAMAERLLARTDLDDAGRVREAFLCAFSRTANEKETARALEGLNRIADSLAEKNLTAEETRRAAWQSLCRVLIASSNFVYVQ